MRLVLLIFCALFALSCAAPITPILKHTWATGILDFTFPTQADRDYYIAHKLYLLCVPNGIKMAPNGDIFVSIRRMGNCPVTFARLLPNFQLEPYPSWEANGGVPNAEQDPAPWRDNADNLQSVLGFEIDSCNRLWILDQGVSVTYPAQAGGAKLMVYDLNNNNLLRTHKFPENVVLPTNSFLDDLVVDLKHNFVYITDAGVPSGAKPAGGVFSNNTRGALIIYDVVKDDSWRVLDSHFSVQPDPYPFWPVAAGERLSNKVDRVNVGADGAGLNPDATLFYYTSLTSQRLFRIPTITLRESRGLQVPEIAGNVTLVVKDTGSIAGGILFGTDGALYLTDLTNSAIKRFVDLPSNDACTVDGCPAGTYVLESIASDALMQWPDGLGFTNSGSMILFANQLQHILNDEPLSNFTMWEVPLGGRSGEVHSYMHNWAPLCVSNDPFADHSTPATDDSSCDRDAAFWGLLAWGIVATLLCIVLIVYVRMRMAQLRKDGALLEY